MLKGLAELARDGALLAERQHRLQTLEPLAGHPDGLGETILGLGGEPSQAGGVEEQRREPDRQEQQHQSGEGGTHRQHHAEGARQGEGATQGHRRAVADQPLDDGHVGGHPREELAGADLDHLGEVELEHVVIDGLAHVHDQPLAQLVDEIDAQGRGQGEQGRHGARDHEAGREGLGGVHFQPAVGQLARRHGQSEGGGARQRHEEDAEQEVAHVGANMGPERCERTQVPAAQALAGGGLERLFQQVAGARPADGGGQAHVRLDHEPVTSSSRIAAAPVLTVTIPPRHPLAKSCVTASLCAREHSRAGLYPPSVGLREGCGTVAKGAWALRRGSAPPRP